MSKFLYAFAGLVVSQIIGILINLLSAAIQQRAFSDQFTTQSIWILAALALVGLLVGTYLGGKTNIPATAIASSPSATASPPKNPSPVTLTRLRALLSYTKLRGRGYNISDIFLIASRLDIDTN